MNCLLCETPIVNNPSFYDLFLKLEPSPNFVCEFCFSKFKQISNIKCIYCFKSNIDGICGDCKYWKNEFGNYVIHKSIYEYDKNMHDFFIKFKRNGDIHLANVFSKVLGNIKWFKNFDLITYIPSSEDHFKKRKFNPVVELYSEVNLHNIFLVINDDGAQAMKNRNQRLNTLQKFKVNKNLDNFKKILIVDDIYTTGRTLNHARQAILSKYPNCYVETFSLVR